MDEFVREYCEYFNWPHNEIMQYIDNCEYIPHGEVYTNYKTFLLNLIIKYKKTTNENINKEDVTKIYSPNRVMSYKRFIKNVKKDCKKEGVNINDLSIKICIEKNLFKPVLYYLSTFLGNHDIKIALKD
jgi:hypothetical protein